MRKLLAKTGAILGLGLAATMATPAMAAPPGAPVVAPDCDRTCLEGYLDKYLTAMADNEVDADLFAKNARFTENGVQMPLGNEGLWATTSGRGHYTLSVPDVETRQIAALVTVMESAGSSATGALLEADPVGISLRLRINDDGKISEVEQIVARPDRPLGPAAAPAEGGWPPTGEAVEALGSPWAGYLENVPEDERHTRGEMVEMANAYFEALQRNTGKDYYPFTDDCLRLENGIVTAGPEGSGAQAGCKKQLETSLLGAITGVRDRRIVAVDQERGIVFAFAFFDHRQINWTWQLGELFKIDKGNISRIEAIFIQGPYGICSGWSTYEQCRSEEAQDIR